MISKPYFPQILDHNINVSDSKESNQSKVFSQTRFLIRDENINNVSDMITDMPQFTYQNRF